MRKEIENLLMELNSDTEYISVSHRTNYFWESISLDDIHLWDSENYNEEYITQQVSAHLMKVSKHLEESVNEILAEGVDKFLKEKKITIKNIAPKAIIKSRRVNTLKWELTLLGEYPETDSFDELMEGIREDFDYVFKHVKLDVVW